MVGPGAIHDTLVFYEAVGLKCRPRGDTGGNPFPGFILPGVYPANEVFKDQRYTYLSLTDPNSAEPNYKLSAP